MFSKKLKCTAKVWTSHHLGPLVNCYKCGCSPRLLDFPIEAFQTNNCWVLLTLLLSHHPFILLCAHLLEQADALITLIIPSSLEKSSTWTTGFPGPAINWSISAFTPEPIPTATALTFLAYKKRQFSLRNLYGSAISRVDISWGILMVCYKAM